MSKWASFRKMIFGSEELKDDGAKYFYVRLYNKPNESTPTDEIVRLRINTNNDLSQDDDGDSYVRKTVVGSKQMKRAELVVYFDSNRSLIHHEITGGELVREADYEVYEQQQK